MEEDSICASKQPASPFCRICIRIKDVNYYMYETVNDNGGTITLHRMLVMLFPAVFNDEQVLHDEIMCLSNRICHECRDTVLKAYDLYRLCETSTGRLEKLLAVEEVVLDESEKKGGVESEEENQLVTQDEMLGTNQKAAELPTDTKAVGSRSSFHLKKIRKIPQKRVNSSQSLKGNKSPRKQVYKMRRTKPSVETIGKEDSSNSKASPNPNEISTSINRKLDDTSSAVINELPKQDEAQEPAKHRKGKHGARGSSRIKMAKQPVPANEHCGQSDEPETKIDIYRCQLCEGPMYTSPTELTDHLKKDHPDLISCCEKCPKVFMSEQTFQHHQYCHAIGRSHFCMFCDKGFVTEELLKGHVRTHTHRTDYLCFLCGKEFSNSSNLRQHVKRHYGEKPFACEQCPMRFSTKGYLTRHQQTHTKIKKFACDTCGSLFSRQYTLVKHQLLHTGARFFSCEVCKMSFTSSDHVKRHMRTHTGEKPYKCGCCGRAFAQSNDMVKHMRTHLGDNAYQCDRCDASYRLLSELRNHYKEHYQPGDNSNSCTAAEDEKEIRFTSMTILNRLFDKKPEQYSE